MRVYIFNFKKQTNEPKKIKILKYKKNDQKSKEIKEENTLSPQNQFKKLICDCSGCSHYPHFQ